MVIIAIGWTRKTIEDSVTFDDPRTNALSHAPAVTAGCGAHRHPHSVKFVAE